MTDTSETRHAKREAALQKLRKRRGESREPIFESRQERELGRIQPLIKAYKSQKLTWANESQKKAEEEAAEVAAGAAVDEPATPETAVAAAEATGTEELPRIKRTKKQLEKKDEAAQAAIAQWRSLMQARRDRQASVSELDPLPIALPQAERRQMFTDLLTVDFLEHTRHWLSSSPEDIDLSTTPPEEVEGIYKQALYRRKVLEMMQKMNEQELDAIALYLRSAGRGPKPGA